MGAAILSIGDELIRGEIADTNAAHISARLYEKGLAVERRLTVGDSAPRIAAALRFLGDTGDDVIITGGLGPTEDDVTARGAAEAFKRRLVLNDEALAHLRRFFEKTARPMHPANEKQALIPSGGVIIPNPTGTACGFAISDEGRFFFFLPGVPGEMCAMLDASVIPAMLERRQQRKTIQTRVLKVFGLSEPQTESLVSEALPPRPGLRVAFCVSFPEIHVKLRMESDTREETERVLDEAASLARERLKDALFAEGDDTMDGVVASLFREKGLTLSLAESCTGGLIAKRITDMPGSSSYFQEGAVTYTNRSKTRILGVPAPLIEEKGAVSAEVARAMAEGMRRASGSDIALSVTGIAGPEGGTPGKPVGTVFIALATSNDCIAKEYRFAGNRDRIRTITSFMAMDWLRRHLSLQ